MLGDESSAGPGLAGPGTTPFRKERRPSTGGFGGGVFGGFWGFRGFGGVRGFWGFRGFRGFRV